MDAIRPGCLSWRCRVIGYAHYWRRSPELERESFTRVAKDVQLILDTLKGKGLFIAGPGGDGAPWVSDRTIAFNGLKDCEKHGHRFQDLGKPWPSKTAQGVEATGDPVVGPWFSGALLETRVCGGCCAGDAFIVDRVFKMRSWDVPEKGRFFCHCETGYKPYDLAVTAALVRLKERLGPDILISSDGMDRGFEDARLLCRDLFGYPTQFQLEPMDAELV